MIATPTSSGKSLTYHVPVLEALSQPHHLASAIYLFPTKALAQDQLRSLRAFIGLAVPKRHLVIDLYRGRLARRGRQVRDFGRRLLFRGALSGAGVGQCDPD